MWIQSTHVSRLVDHLSAHLSDSDLYILATLFDEEENENSAMLTLRAQFLEDLRMGLMKGFPRQNLTEETKKEELR